MTTVGLSSKLSPDVHSSSMNVRTSRVDLAGGPVYLRFGRWSDTAPVGVGTRHRSVAARRWVHEIVEEHCLFAWRGFQPAPIGSKPALANAGDADFSVSYSGAHLLVAVAHHGSVGVDLEVAPFGAFDLPALRRRMCTLAEAERASVLAPALRRRYLARLWTAKEAMTKASGTGLRTDFRTIEPAVDVPEAGQRPLFEACIAHRGELRGLHLDPAQYALDAVQSTGRSAVWLQHEKRLR